jgi:hypothetical protein
MRSFLLVAVLALTLAQAKAPTLDDVIARAAEYVTTFHQGFRTVVAEERYEQMQRTYAQRFSGGASWVDTTPSILKTRKMRSDFALVANDEARAWFAFRDVIEVDGHAVQEARSRIDRALADSPATALEELNRLSREAMTYNLGSVTRNVNVPTMALMVLMPQHRLGVDFKKNGEERLSGVQTWVVTFAETGHPTLAQTRDGSPMPSHGRLWIDPTNGRVVKTEIIWDARQAFPDSKFSPGGRPALVKIGVSYGPEARLGMWVPVEMKELYDRETEVVSCTAEYRNFRRFDTTVRMVPK